MIRRILLRLYPAAWRKEYGEEFAEVLAARPLSLRVAANVMWSATGQRLRDTPWLLAGLCLFLFSLTRMLLQGFGVVSVQSDAGVEWVVTLFLVLTGLWIAMRKDGTFFAGLGGTIKAALTCKALYLALLLVSFSRSTFTMDDSPIVLGSRYEAVGLFAVMVIANGIKLGCCGAFFGSAIKKVGRRFV